MKAGGQAERQRPEDRRSRPPKKVTGLEKIAGSQAERRAGESVPPAPQRRDKWRKGRTVPIEGDEPRTNDVSAQKDGREDLTALVEKCVFKLAMSRHRAVGIAHLDGPVAVDLDSLLRPSRWFSFSRLLRTGFSLSAQHRNRGLARWRGWWKERARTAAERPPAGRALRRQRSAAVLAECKLARL